MKTPSTDNARGNDRLNLNRRAFVKTATLAGAGLAIAPALARAAKGQGRGQKKSGNNAPQPPAHTQPAAPAPASGATGKPNVLMIAIDDLRTWVNYLGHHQAKTPNLDRLAAMSLALTNAHCPAPICNPSRTALLTGLRPSTTGVYGNPDDWRANNVASKVPTLPAWLKQHGYISFAAGKIYHDAYRQDSDWTEYAPKEHQIALPSPTTNPGVADIRFRPLNAKDHQLYDYPTVDYCIDKLRKKFDKPLLLGCGLHKPHMAWEVPQKYFDMHPLDTIELPKVQPSIDNLPPEGRRIALAGGEHAAMLKTGRWKEAVQAYLASITFMDTQIGRLLDAFEKSAYKDNTIILFWVDHGWHHGEKHHWKKFALWEESTHIPVIWRVPGLTKPGTRCARTLDHMGIYPTLCDILGLPLPPHLEGVSYRALLENPGAAWDRPAICTYEQNNHAVRTEKWRYIRYHNGGEELYDHDADPLEWNNLAGDPQYASLKKDLAKWFPTVNLPPQSSRKNGSPRGGGGKRAKGVKGGNETGDE